MTFGDDVETDPSPLVWTQLDPAPTEETIPSRWRHSYLPTWRLYKGAVNLHYDRAFSSHSSERITDMGEDEYKWDQVFAQNIEALWRHFSNQVLTSVQSIHSKGLATILMGILSTHKRKRAIKKEISDDLYNRVSSFLTRQGSPDFLKSSQNFRKKYQDDTQIRRVVDDISKIESQIEKARVGLYKIQGLIQNMFSGNKTVSLEEVRIAVAGNDGKNIGLSSLSSGEKHALWLLIETLLVGESALLVDEPELSLHIDWQTDLLASMRQLNPDAQLIVATHSPEIMAKVHDKYIFRL